MNLEEVINRVLEEVKPREEEYRKLLKVFELVKNRIEKCLGDLGIEFDVTLQGSVAKDTFLHGQTDIDVFVLFKSGSVDSKWFEETFIPKLIHCFSEYRTVLEYATHPYLIVYVDGIEVNIVPAFRVDSPKNLISAVDRTPFHTEYISKKLSPRQRDDVRLLKKFLKAWGIYGAEIKVQGFSGYLAELLIAAYGSFIDVLKAVQKWKPYRTCIDIEGYYASPKECLKKFRDQVLVVVDPVDPNRNAAAAVSLYSFSMLKLVSALFLLKPSIEFFSEEPKYVPPYQDFALKIRQRLEAIDSCIAGFLFRIVKPVPDIVWGQLRRVERMLSNELRNLRFNVVYTNSWTDKDLKLAITLIEIADCSKKFELHEGPPAYIVDNAIKFILKNISAFAGPWIDTNGRLYCIKPKKYTDVAEVLKSLTKRLESLTALKLEKIIVSLEDLPLHLDDLRSWLWSFVMRKQFERLSKILT